MTITAWITVFGIILATGVTLSVAYMQRKQMRQIELFRNDPSVPLTQPPHRFTRFVKEYGFFVVFGGFDLFVLIRDLNQTTPITRRVVFDIVLDMAGVFGMVFLAFVTAILRRVTDAAKKTMQMMDRTTRTMEKISEKTFLPKVNRR
jgi:hypothetical protein